MCSRKLILLGGLCWAVLFAAGCKTPVEVKQALVSLNQGYADNVKLMRQYQQLCQGLKERHKYWTIYVKQRAALDLALRWATTDPQSHPPVSKEQYAKTSQDLLGANVVLLVNQYRLNGLPSRPGPNSTEIFAEGTNSIHGLIQALPAIADAVSQEAAAEYEATVKNESLAFDDYAAKVASLERINEAIERYLAIDVTIKPEAVSDVSGSVRALSGK